MTGLHPALAFVHERMRGARTVGADALVLDVDGARVELFVAPANGGAAFFAAGGTRLGYRLSGALPDPAKERVRDVLLELRTALAAGRVADPHAPLPERGGWADDVDPTDPAWRDWVARTYRAGVETDSRDECHGLPDCLDLRMRPPIAPPGAVLAAPPATGPCARCGRARACGSARERADVEPSLKPLRHADAAGAELAALRVLSAAAAVPLADALASYELLLSACADRSVAGASPLEFSVRLPAGGRAPDRVRFVSYYPMVSSDTLRREINRGRRAAVGTLAARWLGPRERVALETWLECTTDAQPDTLGLSVGVELDATGVRLQVYAHPGPRDAAERLVHAVLRRLGGAPDRIPAGDGCPVLVAIAVAAGRPPAVKLYYHRSWEARGDTGLQPAGLGALAPFNPGWGLAVQEHVDGRAEWVKWDFPVTTHYQVYDRFLAAFWGTTGSADGSVPAWLSGDAFSAWPTWASLGRGGGRGLYFVPR